MSTACPYSPMRQHSYLDGLCVYCGDVPPPPNDRLVWVFEAGAWHTSIVRGGSAKGDAGVLPDGRPWRSAKGDFP